MFRVRRLSGVRGFGIGGVLAGPTFAGSAWEGAVERRGIGWCGARRESQGPPSTGRLSASRERGLAFGVERTRAGLRRQESASWHAGMFGAKTGAGEMGNFNGGVQAAHGRGFGRRG